MQSWWYQAGLLDFPAELVVFTNLFIYSVFTDIKLHCMVLMIESTPQKEMHRQVRNSKMIILSPAILLHS